MGDDIENESSNDKIERLQNENDSLKDNLIALEMQTKEFQVRKTKY